MLDSLAIATDGYASATVKKALIIAVAGYLDYANEGTIVWFNVAGVWKEVIVWYNDLGIWKQVTVWLNVASTWK
jgi:hypothetical protein